MSNFSLKLGEKAEYGGKGVSDNLSNFVKYSFVEQNFFAVLPYALNNYCDEFCNALN